MSTTASTVRRRIERSNRSYATREFGLRFLRYRIPYHRIPTGTRFPRSARPAAPGGLRIS